MKFHVENMTCGHCVRAITQAIQDVDATAKVEIHLQDQQVDVESVLNVEQIQAILNEQGYPSKRI